MTKQRLAAEKPSEDSLLDVEAVGSLLDDEAMGSVDYFVGDFLAAVGGEAMHEICFGCAFHEAGVDLIGGEIRAAARSFCFLTHAGPDVGVDRDGAFDGFGRVFADG